MASVAMNNHLIDRKMFTHSSCVPNVGAQSGVFGIISLTNPQIAPKFGFSGPFLTLTKIVRLQSNFCRLASCLPRLGAQTFGNTVCVMHAYSIGIHYYIHEIKNIQS